MKLVNIPFEDGQVWVDQSRWAKHGEYTLSCNRVKIIQVNRDVQQLFEDGGHPIIAQSNLSNKHPDIPSITKFFPELDESLIYSKDKNCTLTILSLEILKPPK